MQTDPSLFDLPPRMRVYLPGPAPPPIRVEMPTPMSWATVNAFLAQHGFCVQELGKARRELLHELQARMLYRTKENVYQAPTCTIPLFGRSLAEAFFHGLPRAVDKKEVVTWEIHDPDLLAPLLHPFTEAHAYCFGQSKAMGGTKLNQFVNVISTLFTLVASSVCRGGRDILYLNALYVLMNDAGEIDYPKTKDKKPLTMDWEDEQRIRTIIQRDLVAMAEADLCLSSRFLRMLGEEWAWKADAAYELEREHQTAAAVKIAEHAAAEAAASAPELQQELRGENDERVTDARSPEPSNPPAPAAIVPAPSEASRVSSRAARAMLNSSNPRFERVPPRNARET